MLSPDQKAEAARKRSVTREARGTKGKKRKLAIKGTLPASSGSPPQPVNVIQVAAASGDAITNGVSTLLG
jgi:hypothetical protein